MLTTRTRSQHCAPIFLDSVSESSIHQHLTHIKFQPDESGADSHDENWLQNLIDKHSTLLPINEIDAGFGQIVSVCREMPTSAGPVDNVFVTGNGNIVLAECKLWRNPDARRQVVAQIIDYAQAMSAWTYEDFDRQVRKANSSITSVYEHVRENTEMDEAFFVDAVSRNLLLGRVMLLVVGDGIRSGVEALVQSLQHHVGFHFTLALVEMPVFQLPTSGYVVLPRILAKTENIERGIVRIVNERIAIESVPSDASHSTAQRKSISLERGFEELKIKFPDLFPKFEEFLQRTENLGIFVDVGTSSLILRWPGQDGLNYALATVKMNGTIATYNVSWTPNQSGFLYVADEYLNDLASRLGMQVRKTKANTHWYVCDLAGVFPTLEDLVKRPDDWLAAFESYIAKLSKTIAASSTD